jgi:hypothetical protein
MNTTSELVVFIIAISFFGERARVTAQRHATSGGTIQGLSPNLKAWIRDVGRPPSMQARRMLIKLRLGVHI